MVFESPVKDNGSEQKSEVVRLREDEGLTFRKIAERLGKTEASVKMKYRRDISRVTGKVTQSNAEVTESNGKVTESNAFMEKSNAESNAEVTQKIKSEVERQLKEGFEKELQEAKQGVLEDIKEELEQFKADIFKELKRVNGQNEFIKKVLREKFGQEEYERVKRK